MHYLVTGHTGFKGSWLILLLLERGHRVSGMALDPPADGLFERAGLSALLDHDIRVDIRDAALVRETVASIGADVVIHMAAQPLVRESYREPRATFEINVDGTLNVLEAVESGALVVVTTDKVYRNVGQRAGYVESDPLGGDDPYSSSKAMADLLAQSWHRSFPGVRRAIARAGNVIGGGDVSTDRLFPDLLRSFAAGEAPRIRYPASVRPWQHVLDCLNGYLVLAEALLDGRGEGEWNIGPGEESFVEVGTIATLVATLLGSPAGWTQDDGEHPHEAALLALDAGKAERELGWRNRLSFEDSVAWTVDWDRRVRSGEDALEVSRDQVRAFEVRAPASGR
jgi:CDP-glucose 4,6-dehydratase